MLMDDTLYPVHEYSFLLFKHNYKGKMNVKDRLSSSFVPVIYDCNIRVWKIHVSYFVVC